ncbi:MAG: hypothetical protein HGA78_02000 [Nitrospirales bacterium]|nr:hypothetical protein [Nitrospirales bacterium]
MNFQEIRDLAGRFTPEEIESCILQQVEKGINLCKVEGSTEQVINELSKASFVREQMDRGVALMEAVRDLAGRIRKVQKISEELQKEE